MLMMLAILPITPSIIFGMLRSKAARGKAIRADADDARHLGCRAKWGLLLKIWKKRWAR